MTTSKLSKSERGVVNQLSLYLGSRLLKAAALDFQDAKAQGLDVEKIYRALLLTPPYRLPDPMPSLDDFLTMVVPPASKT